MALDARPAPGPRAEGRGVADQSTLYKRSMCAKLRRGVNRGSVSAMRMLVSFGVVQLGVTVLVACGAGRGPTEGASSATEARPSAASPDGSAPADQASATTTTVALGDGGDVQGAKLAEAQAVSSTTGGPGRAPRGAHLHDPGRSPADIRAIVVAHREEARACYDRALSAHPGIEGDLVIQWSIDPKGNVTQVSPDTSRSQIADGTVVACVSDIIRKIQFASSAGGFETKAFYPFNFHPRHGQPAGGQ